MRGNVRVVNRNPRYPIAIGRRVKNNCDDLVYTIVAYDTKECPLGVESGSDIREVKAWRKLKIEHLVLIDN